MLGGAPSAPRIAHLQHDLRSKKSFQGACRALAKLCEQLDSGQAGAEVGAEVDCSVSAALLSAGKTAFTVLRTRYSEPLYWEAGLEFFLSLEFHLPRSSEMTRRWREAAMAEVDEESRERAAQHVAEERAEEQRRRIENLNLSQGPEAILELLAAGYGESGRPPMSRDARDELRISTLLEADTCTICLEDMPAGSKAKLMPCGHRFHDDCLESWVTKNNSCPSCRFDELPSERRHFDDLQRRVQQSDPFRTGLYS